MCVCVILCTSVSVSVYLSLSVMREFCSIFNSLIGIVIEYFLFLSSGDITKGEVVRYATRQAELCCKEGTSDEPGNSTGDPDEGLLWKLLVLLCQQNGVCVM